MRLAEKGSPLSLSAIVEDSRFRLQGYLDLRAENRDGRTTLSRKAFKSPIHISKPYWDENSLLLNVMSPTAGLLRGDEVKIQAEVDSHASLILSSPTALRIHKMESGSASWSQRFSIKPNGFLEYNPEWLILQEASSLHQQTEITLEEEAELLFIEAIAAGRVAYKERFAFSQLTNRLKITHNGTLSSLERYKIEPSSNRPQPWITAGKPFFVSIILSSPKLSDESSIWNEIYQLNDSQQWIGSTRLAKGPLWNVRILSDDPVKTRATIDRIRQRFYKEIQRPLSKLRR